MKQAMLWKAAALAGAFFLLVPAGAGVNAIAAAECDSSPATTIAVAKILDGRTVQATDGAAVLLAGIEVPEASAQAVAQSRPPASVYLESETLGRQVRLAGATAPDRYGRVHAQLFLDDGRWLQGELVAAGLAIVHPEGDAEACIGALLELEQAARAARLGIWSDPDSPLRTADDPSLSERNGLYGLVEGRVLSVGFGSSMVFLDFGRDHRTDFTVMVPRPVVARLTDAGIPVDAMKGRTIRVRGVIEESGGPAIRIADPNELELVSHRQ
jgi:endonuclease YncB( thermonuclease family)